MQKLTDVYSYQALTKRSAAVVCMCVPGYPQSERQWCLYAATLLERIEANDSILSVSPLPEGELWGF